MAETKPMNKVKRGTITVSDDYRQRLNIIKQKLGFKNIEELIKFMENKANLMV
jgi:hypothetical protein